MPMFERVFLKKQKALYVENKPLTATITKYIFIQQIHWHTFARYQEEDGILRLDGWRHLRLDDYFTLTPSFLLEYRQRTLVTCN